MIYRGIVEKIIDKYTVKVRIPLIHRASISNEYIHLDNLPEAKISTLPNTHPNIQCGDVVVVAFENNDSTRPIIIGYLYREDLNNTAISTTVSSLEVIDETKLSSNTSIGDISSENLQALAGIKENIQQQINQLETEIVFLQKEDEKYADLHITDKEVNDLLAPINTDLTDVSKISKANKGKIKNIEAYLGDMYKQGKSMKDDLHTLFPTIIEFNKLVATVNELKSYIEPKE